jgi:alpha-tubulin suppressor-like RCC1 family protein
MFTKATRVAAGFDHACAIDDGKVWCWGSNDEGQLGHDPGTDASCSGGDAGPAVKCKFTPTEVMVPAGKAVDIAAGKGFTCVRTDGKEVYCWGTNANGITGRAPGGFSATPNKVGFPASDVEEIAVGSPITPTHGCARRTSGEVWCWGKNDVGQLGQATPAVSATPLQVQNLQQVQHIVVGENTACAFRAIGDTLCWGSHARGGLGTANAVDTMPHAAPEPVKQKWGITGQMFGGVATFWALDSVGNAWVWGANAYGTFGDSTITGAACGNDVCDPNTKMDPSLNGYRAVSASNHVLGISKGGRLWAWGQNKYGQLGKAPGGLDQNCANNQLCNPVPTLIQGI